MVGIWGDHIGRYDYALFVRLGNPQTRPISPSSSSLQLCFGGTLDIDMESITMQIPTACLSPQSAWSVSCSWCFLCSTATSSVPWSPFGKLRDLRLTPLFFVYSGSIIGSERTWLIFPAKLQSRHFRRQQHSPKADAFRGVFGLDHIFDHRQNSNTRKQCGGEFRKARSFGVKTTKRIQKG